MSSDGVTELPIFELPIVVLPGELVPLHIFEERYKAMIGYCLERDEPFGIVFRDEDSGARAIGCSAAVAEVLQRLEDDRLNIVVTGGAPFRVLDRYEGDEFPLATVELIDLADEPADRDPDAAERAREAFELLAREAADEDDEEVAEAGQGGAYDLAGRITLPPETKQKLLETRSEAERMQTLARALEAVVNAVQRSKKIAESAQTNGHARL